MSVPTYFAECLYESMKVNIFSLCSLKGAAQMKNVTLSCSLRCPHSSILLLHAAELYWVCDIMLCYDIMPSTGMRQY